MSRMSRFSNNQIIALILFVFSLGYLIMAYQIPTYPIPRPVDSDTFPKLLGFALLALSVFLYFEKEAKTEAKTEATPTTESGIEPAQANTNTWAWHQAKGQLVITALAIIAYALLVKPLGFVISTTLFGFGLSYVYGYRRLLLSFITISLVVLALYLLMNKVMGIHLANGPLPF